MGGGLQQVALQLRRKLGSTLNIRSWAATAAVVAVAGSAACLTQPPPTMRLHWLATAGAALGGQH